MANENESAPLPFALSRYFNEQESDESLDYAGFHGYVTGSVIVRDEQNPLQLIQEGLDEEPAFASEQQKVQVLEDLEGLIGSITNTFFLTEELTLPFSFYIEEGLEGSELESWCEGLVEALLAEEENLLFQKEDPDSENAEEFEMILPFLIISGLFDEDEKDLEKLRSNSDFITAAINDLPQMLTDFYLHLRRE